MKERTNFKFNIESVLKILSNDIYDSPLSLLRENVQNAYDAILQRRYEDKSFTEDGGIDILLEGNQLTIADNGIGMTKEMLDKNYWTAGSSGKNTPEARAAGVVGTFGIGAMANFGVCSYLEVTSKYYNGEYKTIRSSVKRDELETDPNCIQFDDEIEEFSDPGTTVKVLLLPDKQITVQQVKDYLRPYVRYIPIPVLLNGELISKEVYEFGNSHKEGVLFFEGNHSRNRVQFDYRLLLTKGGKVTPKLFLYNLKWLDQSVEGNMLLVSGESTLFGYRNSFGLAPVPVSSTFGYGGVVNLLSLTPTAGRDAISRESINMVAQIVAEADYVAALCIAKTEMADISREFLRYIRYNSLFKLGENVNIFVYSDKPGVNETIRLKDLTSEHEGRMVRYYTGMDQAILKTYTDADNIVLRPSEDSDRRQVQMYFINQVRIPMISDSPQVTYEFKDSELDAAEYSIKWKVENILKHDYLFSLCEIQFAEISHGLPVLAKCEGDKLTIYLRRKSNELNYLCEIYKNDYSLLEPLVKDYVRTSLYTKFSQYVPSSQKGGAEYMYKMLLQRKEDWSYESTEVGNIESVWDAYLHGKANMEEVAAVINRVNTAHTQTVAPNNIGNIIEVLGEQKLPQPAAPAEPNNGGIPPIEALPPIMRIDKQTNLKILVADSDEQRINGYKSFLALSDSVKNFYMDFFMQPHTTRIIWSMHRIIYIFTLLSGSLTLYYDMELKTKLEKDMTGGKAITTSTIITKNRIFVPIIPEMEEYFDIKEGNRKFVVRFDDIRS